MSDLVGNPEDRFSPNKAQVICSIFRNWMKKYELHPEKTLSSGFPNRPETNPAVQLKKMARDLKFLLRKQRIFTIYVAKTKAR